MSFDAIPEDKEESHPCECGGNITKRKNKSETGFIIWECNQCDFERKQNIELECLVCGSLIEITEHVQNYEMIECYNCSKPFEFVNGGLIKIEN